ncbi:MAG: DNA-processing protein DprA [Tissierellaceae bacterium]|nr:DNA-processing protein DprA [Tissierellaceae bacterium]
MSKYLERDILIWLSSINISNSSIKKLFNYFTDIREILDVGSDNLFKIPGMNKDHIQRILTNRYETKIDYVLKQLNDNNIKTLTYIDENYPTTLNYIYDTPFVLYYNGEFKEEDKLSLAIVGARKATAYGKWACEKFTKELVDLGVTIVSGLALGIDTIAHKTALKYGGRTVAILGNGLDVKYPKKNEKLYDEISKNGVVLTEFPIGTQPLAYNFPQRNRIISGLSLAVVVIEAKEKSGSLITAHHALEQGKDVFAVPGNINSIYSGGTNKLIKDGAFPLLDIDDLLEEIYELKEKTLNSKYDSLDYTDLSDTEIKIVNTLKEGPLHTDMIIHKSGLDTSTVLSVLTILQIKGIIKELTRRTYAIS